MLSIDTALARHVQNGRNLLEVTKRKSVMEARTPSLPLPGELPVPRRTLSFLGRSSTLESLKETAVDFALGLTRCASPENIDPSRCTGDCVRSSEPSSKARVVRRTRYQHAPKH